MCAQRQAASAEAGPRFDRQGLYDGKADIVSRPGVFRAGIAKTDDDAQRYFFFSALGSLPFFLLFFILRFRCSTGRRGLCAGFPGAPLLLPLLLLHPLRVSCL